MNKVTPHQIIGHGHFLQSTLINKIELLGLLIGYAVLSPKFEINEVKIVRPLVKTIKEVCNLAIKNYQPSRFKSWKETQDSKWLGHKI